MQAGEQDLRPAEAGEEPGQELKGDAAPPPALCTQNLWKSRNQ